MIRSTWKKRETIDPVLGMIRCIWKRNETTYSVRSLIHSICKKKETVQYQTFVVWEKGK